MSDYEYARTINLTPEKDPVVSFEEAFGGEYSNASGKRAQKRAERQEKRVTRIENRNVRKETRGVAKQTRKDAVATAKTNRKVNKRVLKQQGKTAVAQERLNRNAIKAQAAKDAARENNEEVLPNDEVANSSEPTNTQLTNGAPPQESLVEQEQQDTGVNTEESQAPDAAEVAMDTDDTEPNSAPDEGDNEQNWEPDFESSFSGDEQFSTEANDADNAIVINIHPTIRNAAEQQVFHELKAHKYRGQIGNGGNDIEAQTNAQMHMQKAKTISNFLEEYCNAAGGNAKKAAYRKKVVHTAMKEARQGWKNKIAAKKKTAGTTHVAKNLDPQISNDKIVIPAEETSGIKGSRTEQEISSAEKNPNTRVFEVTSNASGPLNNPNWKSYLVGIGLAIGVIFVLSSTNVLKSIKK